MTTTRKLETLVRRQKVEHYLRRGVQNQAEIALGMGVSESTIARDVEAIYERWKALGNKDLETKLEIRINQLLDIVTEARASYELSKLGKVKVIRITPCADCGGSGNECASCQGKGEVETEEMVQAKRGTGDSSFLAVARDTLKEVARLEGLYPVKEKTLKVEGQMQHSHAGVIVGVGVSGSEVGNAIADAVRSAPPELLLEARSVLDRLLTSRPLELVGASAPSVEITHEKANGTEPGITDQG